MPFTTLNDPSQPEAVPSGSKSARTIAQSILLVILFLEWPRRAGCFVLGSAELVAFVILVLSIWAIQLRQWVLLGVVAAVVGFNILTSLDRPGFRNESAAVANLRTINTAQVTYLSSSNGIYGAMTDLIGAGLLDDTFTGTKAGYNYSILLDATGSAYTAEAVPVSSQTGRYGYYSFPDAVVRYSTNTALAPAGQAGKSVQ